MEDIGAVTDLAPLIVDVPDWPTPGVIFKDLTPLLADATALATAVDAVAALADGAVDVVVGIEARGFVFAAPVARALGVGFVPIRKAGKLPRETYAQTYDLEYGSATIEMHRDAISVGQRVLLVDDVLATGGTAAAAAELIARAGGIVTALAVLVELEFLAGRARVAPLRVASVIRYS